MSTAQVEYYGRGQSAKEDGLNPGDILLTRRKGWTSKLIQFGQAWRSVPEEEAYSHWTHAALIFTDNGFIAEALEWGVEYEHISKYRDHDYAVVHFDFSQEDRNQIITYATSVLNARENGYGYITILAIALTMLTGWSLVFGTVGSAICSGFVAEALTRAGVIFPKPPAYCTPFDLAQLFRVSGSDEEVV